MTKPEAKCGAVGMVEHVRDKLLTHAEMVKGRPVNEATLALLPSGDQCAQLAEWLGAALPELESACDERRTRSQQRVDGRAGRTKRVKEERWWEVELLDEENGEWSSFMICHGSRIEAMDYALEAAATVPDMRLRVVVVFERRITVEKVKPDSPIDAASATGEEARSNGR